MSSVQVAVRVRPLNKREKQLSSKVIVHMKENTASIHKPSSLRGDKLKDRGKIFSFDFSFDSTDSKSSTFASQEKIFQDLGSDVIKAAFEGFNVCLFAYGQTGSGKTYTMMGHKVDKGLIPRICEGLFLELSNRSKTETVSFHTEVSYLEIYSERVHDLLKKKSPSTDGGGLKVREHPYEGPYVENLSKHVVHSHGDVEALISLGNTNRTVASTGMNDFSSRSHAIFTITFTQAWFDAELPREKRSKIHLVDLAGSERADATHTAGPRLKEGANINKSLVTLGSVISALADIGEGGQLAKKKQIFISYRDSVLTWLLKDSLGGNSKTTMIATISPADSNYAETLNTLRYASRAKNIVNTPQVNEDGTVKMIRELQAEVARLQIQLAEAVQGYGCESPTTRKVEEKLHQKEAKIEVLTKQWTSKWEETPTVLQVQYEETVALRMEGSGVVLNCQLPHLIGINKDLLTTGIRLYYLKEGRTLIGSEEALCSRDVVLDGPGLLLEHCLFENSAGIVVLFPQDGAPCSVNGSVLSDPCQLSQGAVIELRGGTTLWFNHPGEASQLKERRQRGLLSAFWPCLTDSSKSTENASAAMQQDSSHLIQMDVPGAKSQSTEPKVALKSTPEKNATTAIPERDPVPHTSLELDGDALQGGVGIGDGQEQERDLCHKSGPGLVSESPQWGALSGAGVASYNAEELWSGDASLQQTSVLGPGDGCGMKPKGNANEIRGVVTDCYKGRPGSEGSSLGSMSHLLRNGGSGFTSVLPETSTQMACCPPKDTTFGNQHTCEEMDESGGVEEIPEVGLTETAAPADQNSGLASLFSRVSWLFRDAHRLLWSPPTLLQQVATERLQPVGAAWANQVISLVKESSVLSVVKDSQAFSVAAGKFIFSFFKDYHIFSVVNDLSLVQLLQTNITPHFQLKEAAWVIQSSVSPDDAQRPALTSAQTKTEELQDDEQQTSQDFTEEDSQSQQKQDGDDIHAKQNGENVPEPQLFKQISMTQASEGPDKTLDNLKHINMVTQTLIEFPDALMKFQNVPLQDMMDSLQSIVSSVPSSQIRALFWLSAAKCRQPEPQPGLLILMDTDLYTLTADSGLPALFHHLPLLQLKEMQIGLGGQSLHLISTAEDGVLCVYTHSQKNTKELCRAILDAVCPEDGRISQHPLIHEDLMKLSLDSGVSVPDLLLDTGLKLYCRFQRSFADLVYHIYSNMNEAEMTLGDVQLLMYTSVAVQMAAGPPSKRVAQFFLSDTHLGLVREEAVCHPAPQAVTTACRSQFHDLTIRRCSDVRCILVHDEDKNGMVGLDLVLSARARGHPESVALAATSSERALNSSPPPEVWKLTFSCSAEATCLINHLSNV
nr:uncharacterized protein kif16bb isoform X1 [Nothobranchius furzeri]